MTRDENHELAIHFWADGTQPDPLHGSMETLSAACSAEANSRPDSRGNRTRFYESSIISIVPTLARRRRFTLNLIVL